MMKRTLHLTVLTFLLLLSAACNRSPNVITVTVQVEKEVITTETVIITATPSDTNAEANAETDAPAEEIIEPTAEISPVQATQQALLALVPTRAPAVAEDVIADDDYVGIVDQACGLVQENYVRDNFNGVDWTAVCETYRAQAANITDSEALWELLGSMIGELHDNHSRFVSPARFAAEFNLPAEGTGRPWPGMTIWPAREDEHVMVWDVCGHGPAVAWLQRGDIIESINGVVPTRGENGYDSGEINGLLYDNSANKVTLMVRRGPDREPEEINIRYGGASGCDGWKIDLLSETPRVGYIRVPNFGGDSNTNILDAITILEEDGALDGLVVDVRHNGGGNSDKDIAIFTTGIFGQVGPLRADATQTIYRIRGPVRWNEETPMAVLTDGSSHSAAEYFATAMQQSGRAVIVGAPTAGNTEGINSFNLADGSLIRLAWMTLQLPDGSSLEGVGVQPDIAVPLGEFGLREGSDVQLEAAYKAITE